MQFFVCTCLTAKDIEWVWDGPEHPNFQEAQAEAKAMLSAWSMLLASSPEGYAFAVRLAVYALPGMQEVQSWVFPDHALDAFIQPHVTGRDLAAAEDEIATRGRYHG